MMQGFERNRIFWHLICTHLKFLFIICLKIPPLMYLLSLKVKTRFFNKILIPVYSISYVWICFIFLSFCLVPIYREKKTQINIQIFDLSLKILDFFQRNPWEYYHTLTIFYLYVLHKECLSETNIFPCQSPQTRLWRFMIWLRNVNVGKGLKLTVPNLNNH